MLLFPFPCPFQQRNSQSSWLAPNTQAGQYSVRLPWLATESTKRRINGFHNVRVCSELSCCFFFILFLIRLLCLLQFRSTVVAPSSLACMEAGATINLTPTFTRRNTSGRCALFRDATEVRTEAPFSSQPVQHIPILHNSSTSQIPKKVIVGQEQ